MSSSSSAPKALDPVSLLRRFAPGARVGVNTLAALLLTVTAACSGGASAATPDDCSESEGAAPGFAPPGQTKALPRYFTLELAGTETRVDGQPLRGHDLSVRIDTEAKDPDNGGALIRLEREFSGEVLGAIVWELSTAGFAHIIVWRREPGAPEEPALEAPPDAETPTPAAAPPQGAAVPGNPTSPASSSVGSASTPSAASSSVAPDAPAEANVRTIGLHVGGGPNDDETRNKFIAPIEKQFDALLRCQARAEKRDRNASVGVDLLIPASGGRAKMQDLRTSLKGEPFKTCVQGVLEKVEFPSLSRTTVVSYSMLFEPVAK